ncbi:hypothetical protein D3C78_1592970 [compost metagenome]
MTCALELTIDALEASTTRLATSLSWRVAEDTSRIEPWIRSTKRLKASASSPNSSLVCIARRLVRSPSPWAMSCMAQPRVRSGFISTRISMLNRKMMQTTTTSVAMSAEVRNSLSMA